MERKTKITAEDGKQEITITRDFELPLALLFKAYQLPEVVAQWMGTKVVKLDNKDQGGYIFETTDPKGNMHRFSGTIHRFSVNKEIIRTFELENTPFGVQLEFLRFEELDSRSSRLVMHVIYESVKVRDLLLQLPFAQGIDMAHNRLEKLLKTEVS